MEDLYVTEIRQRASVKQPGLGTEWAQNLLSGLEVGSSMGTNITVRRWVSLGLCIYTGCQKASGLKNIFLKEIV